MTESRLNLPIFLFMLFLSHLIMAQAQPKRIALHPMEETASIHGIPVVATKHKDIGILPTPPTPSVVMPLAEYRVTSGFGWRRHPVTGKQDFHNGIDLAFRAGIVRNIMQGTVESTGYHRNLGNYVRIDHGFVKSIYGHLSRITVSKGQPVSAGYPLGITGNTGRTTGEHLHFSIRRNGMYIDPWKFLHSVLKRIENEY
ncbi:M23 family metallopeptidase [Sphingobacterium kitahiroshimense]|uniref:M23 family metallopeptidase n=1 Tax=Sphingobacterium kitahiroshimense TaxID=470446 RepID=A0ABV0BM39_9SPHI